MRAAWVSLLLLSSCGGTTGSALVTSSGQASGPSDAAAPLSFSTGAGAEVTLTSAKLHLGAVYLNQSLPASGAAAGPCVSPGIYVAQLFGPLDVDLLSPVAVPFPSPGQGTETQARTAEVWLSGGDVNASADSTLIFDAEGTAAQDGLSYPFSATVTISANRTPQVTNPAMPGASPICHQRIVTPILVDITPRNGGALELQIDPRPIFDAVDFSQATKVSDDPAMYQIPDSNAGPGGALFKGLSANFGVYTFTFR
jgi:hypothetical protein